MGIRSRVRLKLETGTGGGGSGVASGDAIDSTQTIAGTPFIWDVEEVARPITIEKTPNGDVFRILTTTNVDALLDADHASWAQLREDGFNNYETITSTGIVGIQARRISGSGGTGTVRVFARETGPGYNPVYDPLYDVGFAGLQDARRFFDQATMGAAFDEPQTLLSSGDTAGEWLDAQIALASPVLSTVAVTAGNPGSHQTLAWHLQNIWGDQPQQLRMRVAFAISQIIVAGYIGNGTNQLPRLWQQGIIERALGNYRDLLRWSTEHWHMGSWLDNYGNNAYGSNQPSQNYGRELIQLFTMGTRLLNKDGSFVLDASGNTVDAYTQAEVVALSKYLCGWNMKFAPDLPGVGISPADGRMLTQPQVNAAVGTTVKIHYNGVPLTPLLGYDETDYPALAQIEDITDAQVRARMEACIDILMRQQTTGVYICKQLIQKLVTDSPSPQYIRRVVAAWEDDGTGEIGNMSAVVRAILLDVEARGNAKPALFGRAQEPILSVMKRLRYGGHIRGEDAEGNINTVRIWCTYNTPNSNVLDRMGQMPSQNITVFNDYGFEFTVGGVEAPAASLWRASALLANVSNGLSASPSLGAATAQTVADQFGRWYSTGAVTLYTDTETATSGDAATKRAAAHAAIVDRMYADFHQGAAPVTAERNELLGLLDDLHAAGDTAPRLKIAWLINFLSAIPRAAITN